MCQNGEFLNIKLRASHLCKVFFSRQIFLLCFVKGKFGGKKITLQKSESTLQRSFCLKLTVKKFWSKTYHFGP
jgi:hypothetical protein